MSTLTVRLPDDTHERLNDLARHRGVSVNKLMGSFPRSLSRSTTRRREFVLWLRENPSRMDCACSTSSTPHWAVPRVDEPRTPMRCRNRGQ
jgi:hypothetical protein